MRRAAPRRSRDKKSFIARQSATFLCAADAAALCLAKVCAYFQDAFFLRCSRKFFELYSSRLLAQKLALNNFTPESHSPAAESWGIKFEFFTHLPRRIDERIKTRCVFRPVEKSLLKRRIKEINRGAHWIHTARKWRRYCGSPPKSAQSSFFYIYAHGHKPRKAAWNENKTELSGGQCCFSSRAIFHAVPRRLSTPTRHVSSAIEDDTMGVVVFCGQRCTRESESVALCVRHAARVHIYMAEGNTKIYLTSTHWCFRRARFRSSYGINTPGIIHHSRLHLVHPNIYRRHIEL